MGIQDNIFDLEHAITTSYGEGSSEEKNLERVMRYLYRLEKEVEDLRKYKAETSMALQQMGKWMREATNVED